jgi:hypothetical protein
MLACPDVFLNGGRDGCAREACGLAVLTEPGRDVGGPGCGVSVSAVAFPTVERARVVASERVTRSTVPSGRRITSSLFVRATGAFGVGRPGRLAGGGGVVRVWIVWHLEHWRRQVDPSTPGFVHLPH